MRSRFEVFKKKHTFEIILKIGAMKNRKNRLIAIGSLTLGVSLLVQQFFGFPDFIFGAMTGVGIGLLLLVFRKPMPRNSQGA
jgi:hypothetical protein